ETRLANECCSKARRIAASILARLFCNLWFSGAANKPVCQYAIGIRISGNTFRKLTKVASKRRIRSIAIAAVASGGMTKRRLHGIARNEARTRKKEKKIRLSHSGKPNALTSTPYPN